MVVDYLKDPKCRGCPPRHHQLWAGMAMGPRSCCLEWTSSDSRFHAHPADRTLQPKPWTTFRIRDPFHRTIQQLSAPGSGMIRPPEPEWICLECELGRNGPAGWNWNVKEESVNAPLLRYLQFICFCEKIQIIFLLLLQRCDAVVTTPVSVEVSIR